MRKTWLSILVLLCGCASSDSLLVDNSPESAVMAGMAALSGAVNAGNGAPGAISRYAAITSCGNPVINDPGCVSSKKTATYTNCTVTTTKQRYSGNVTLAFSNPACTTTNNGETITRTLEITRSLGYPNDDNPESFVKTSTAPRSDWRTIEFGGGTRLTLASAPDLYQLEILGVNKTRYVKDPAVSINDISIRTLEAITVTGNLGATRTVNGGKLEFSHDRARFVAEAVPTNLIFDSTQCCHPSSGTLEITYTSSSKVTGTASLSFTNATCGTAKFTRDGATTLINLHGCE